MNEFMKLSLDDRKLVVGIDFGTTFSGVAWAETRRPDIRTVIEVWPATLDTHEGTSSPKVPTELRYTPAGLEWGFQIPAMAERHQWFKLGLEKQQAVSAQEMSSEELAAEYLKKLYEHLMYTLEQKLGASVLRTIPTQFCLTVPAIWPEMAKEKTLAACRKAGLQSNSEIILVSEPEAAAIYALDGLDPHGLKVGDSFVLCDAGGGTVDLISYTVAKLRPSLEIREAAPGSGGLCGSTFLNRAFGEFLIQKLGHDPNWEDEILEEAMERFDSVIKKQFTDTAKNAEGYTIPVPGLATNEQLGIRRGRLSMTRREVKSIFDPIVDQIVKLVKDQIIATKVQVKAVLLVGGFGQNNYLKDKLRSSLSSSVKVLQPPNAWTAVVRGAVMMGMALSNPALASVGIASRAARKHYGISLRTEFDATKHDENLKFWSSKHGMYKINHMHWLINKGDPVEERKPISIKYSTRNHVVGQALGVVEMMIRCAESEIAPTHEDDSVRDLVRLKADLSHLSRSDVASLKRHHGADGIERYDISAKIEATFYSASTKYVLVYNGMEYDSVTAEYV